MRKKRVMKNCFKEETCGSRYPDLIPKDEPVMGVRRTKLTARGSVRVKARKRM